ncbi:MAG: hypothetical protein ACRDHW_23120, partial [Ktedonobacteraceae bacterium]
LPASSFVPAAVLSATGCGLLVTALRKLRGRTGVGLWEAGLAGLFLALFQFAIALTYPALLSTLKAGPGYTPVFLITWGLIGFFAIVLSIIGATLGHLAFAPLRPLSARATQQVSETTSDEESEESEEVQETSTLSGESANTIEEAQRDGEAAIVAPELLESTTNAQEDEQGTEAENAEDGQDTEVENAEDDEESEEASPPASRQPNVLITYSISALLLGFLPMMAGYIFAAASDFVLNANNIARIYPAVYPTLSLLSGLLPWQIVLHLNVLNEAFTIFTHLWRIPDAPGNPNIFDVQALEPFLLNAAALALLLLTMYGRESYKHAPKAAPWGAFIGLEALLGLV